MMRKFVVTRPECEPRSPGIGPRSTSRNREGWPREVFSICRGERSGQTPEPEEKSAVIVLRTRVTSAVSLLLVNDDGLNAHRSATHGEMITNGDWGPKDGGGSLL